MFVYIVFDKISNVNIIGQSIYLHYAIEIDFMYFSDFS